MKILLLTHIYPPAVDGGSRVIAQIGEYFRKNDHEIRVVTTNCYSTDDFVNPKSKDVILTDHYIYRLPIHKHLRRPLKLIRLVLSKFINPKTYFLHLLRVLEKGPILKLFPLILHLVSCIMYRPDLIIAGPLPTAIAIYARFFRFLINVLTRQRSKLLINASFHPDDSDFQLKPLIQSLQKADFLWTLTDYETDYFHQNFNIPYSKMINVGNGIDSSFLVHESCFMNHESNILFVGSFSAHKNIETLIDAFAALSPDFPKLTLTLAGQQTLYWPHIQHKIDQLPSEIKNKVNLVFNFSDDRLAAIYNRCSILVQPSSHESFGLTLLEAWARHKPVIVSDIPPFQELINKSKGGLIFTLKDPASLATQIKKILNDPKLSSELANNGYTYTANNATWDKIGKNICQKVTL